MANVAIINDTSLYNNHFGCQLVGQTIREQCARVGMTIRYSVPLKFQFDVWKKRLQECDLLIVNGEGSVHHGKNGHLVALAQHFRTALINCVYQDNPDWPAVRQLVYCSARESLSAASLSERGVACEVVPDLILASSLLSSFRGGPVAADVGVTDNVRAPDAGFRPFTGNPAVYLGMLCQYRRICAGRFHAALAAAVLGIPFSTWDSNTWKMRGLMQDMGLEELHRSTQKAALRVLPELLSPKVAEYVRTGRSKIFGQFDHLAKIASGKT